MQQQCVSPCLDFGWEYGVSIDGWTAMESVNTGADKQRDGKAKGEPSIYMASCGVLQSCLLYTSDAADDM
eukprot:9067309-Prorocentrum_lima.AAC.1